MGDQLGPFLGKVLNGFEIGRRCLWTFARLWIPSPTPKKRILYEFIDSAVMALELRDLGPPAC